MFYALFIFIVGQTIVGPSDYVLRFVFFITGETIVWPSDYVLRFVFFYSGSSPRPIPTSDIPNSSDLLWVEIAAL